MRFGALLCCGISIACTTPNPPPQPTTPPRPITGSPTIAARPAPPSSSSSSSALVAPSTRRTKLESPHGGTIVQLAVTSAGTAAITVDDLGGVRLWPALDGSLEPRVVDIPIPKTLSIVPESRGFTIAWLDDAGGLGIAIVDRDGIVVQRAAVAGDPPYVSVAASEHGIVARRADQELQLLALDGAIAGRLTVAPGSRLASIAVREGRALALVDSGASGIAQWVQLAPQFAWGTKVPGTIANPATAELSIAPSGKRFAVSRRMPSVSGHVAVVDASTGKVVAQDIVLMLAAAIVDDAHVATALPGTAAVQPIAKWSNTPAPAPSATPANPNLLPPPPRGTTTLAVGGGRAFSGASADLAIWSVGTKPQYLGYDVRGATIASPAPDGLVVAVDKQLFKLDSALAVAPFPMPVPAATIVSDVRWLGGTDWLLQTSRTDDGITAVDLVDVATARATAVRKNMRHVHVLLYEPTTKLATVSLGDHAEVLRYDTTKHAVTRVALLPKHDRFERTELVPVAPLLAGGVQLVVVHMSDRLTIRWVKDAAKPLVGTALQLDASLAAVDAAGTVYVWQTSNGATRALRLVAYRAGKQVAAMPTDGPTGLWPDPRGGKLVQVSQRTTALVDATGTRTWAHALQGISEAIWLEDGSIALVGPTGIARLDAKTGDVLATRCGWKFGLAAAPRRVFLNTEPICTQLR